MLDLHGCKRIRMQSHPFHYTVILWSQATSQPNTRWVGHRPPCKLLFSPSCLWFAHMCSITRCHAFPPFRASAVTQGGSQQIRCAGSPASDTNQVTSGDKQLLLLFLLCTLPFWTQAVMILFPVKGACMNLRHQSAPDKSFRLANKIQSTPLHSLQMSSRERRNVAFCVSYVLVIWHPDHGLVLLLG